jgi:DtxR family Mn-dependent transcriptional regulator
MYGFDLSEHAEEALAKLWTATEEQGHPCLHIHELKGSEHAAALAELLEAGLVEQHAGTVTLTGTGRTEAQAVIRRERLAERLLTDVLDLGPEQATEAACQFEHHLRRGIDDEICTLLGHPQVCPHGSPIPPGECCRAGTAEASRVISSLAHLRPGQGGVIAYLVGRRRELMQRLLAMGVLPGAEITLQQAAPSFVFQIGETQVAVDQETAEDIYLRLMDQPPLPANSVSGRGRRRGFGFGRGRRGR